MTRGNRYDTLSLFAVAAMLSVVACTDNPNAILITGPIDPSQPIQPSPSRESIAGRISVSGTGADLVVELTDGYDKVYRLWGSQLGALASVDGGDVVARGTFDLNPGFVVDEFPGHRDVWSSGAGRGARSDG